MRWPVRHPIVLVPGILGSVLDGPTGPLWAPGKPLLQSLTELRDADTAGHPLTLRCDTSSVRASGLFPGVAVLPGLSRIKGYAQTVDWVRGNFAVTDGPGGGLLTFPYDWRLDNRVHARRLAEAIDLHVSEFRERTGAKDAKAVVVAHGMGGLIARYYVEVLGGWRDCRALITLGTPHRGSVRALDTLANGFRHLPGVRTLTRGFPSVHQLLPVYSVIDTGAGYIRIEDAAPLPGVRQDLVGDGLGFHREIAAAAAYNAESFPAYAQQHVTLPLVGTRQSGTLQSARWNGHGVVCSAAPPGALVPPVLADGDGAVPRVSAMPPALPEDRCRFVPAAHSALQSPRVLTGRLLPLLLRLQSPGPMDVRGQSDPLTLVAPAISSEVDDAYPGSAPATLRARVVGAARPPERLLARVTGEDGETLSLVLSEVAPARYEVRRVLPPGLYEIEIAADSGSPVPEQVQDCFAVLPHPD
ncbi:lipase/acyltransferase domain-containing protein [Streptomyces sp. NBC_01451]|uniref:lipase/acyltransferase domain-containing protein n=1 Tax=Streptomyces sp. NBC_01451 TaxID=2903872 RepID=UPI002E326792|nr:hypothetical protein [Streptomyces sp. NBC_01451]